MIGAITTAVQKEKLDTRLSKALAHPLRVQILIILNERVASPNELAKELDEGLSLVSYHVKVLKDFNCIELVSTRPRRGATEHFYRAIRRPYLNLQDWNQVPGSAREAISASVLEMIIQDSAQALTAGTFDARADRHLSRTPVVLDEEGWRDLHSLLDETLERVLDLQAQSAERMAGAADESILAKVALIGFESPQPK